MVTTAIKIISLEDSVQRRAEFSQQISGFDLDWSFFSAYRGVVSPLEYNELAARRRFGYALSPSEIGCYTSHFKCWEWLAQSEYEQAVIFEDDVLVDWRAIQDLAKHNFSDYGIHFLRLFATHPMQWKIIKFRFLSPHYHLIRTRNICFGLQGYILSKAAAQRLVSNYAKITSPVDWIPTRYWEHKLENYSLFPFPVIERHVPSTIGDKRSNWKKMSFPNRLIRLSWKIRDRVRRKFYDYTIKRWPLGHTVDAGDAFLK
jgi:glycosyl transferase, family 25